MRNKNIYPSLHYNEEKTAITLVVISGNPVSEQEFLAAVYDWMAEHKDAFTYEDVGALVEFEIEVDEEYDGSPKH